MTTEPQTTAEERLRSQFAEERLRIYLIDRVSAALLHSMRNTLQAVMGHAALLRLPMGEGLAAGELSLKLQTAAEHCSESLDALNAVLCLPRHRHMASRIHALLRTIEPMLHDAVKAHHFLRISVDPALDRVRVPVQPLAQLLLLVCILSTESGEKGRSLLIELFPAPPPDSQASDPVRTIPALCIRFSDARASFSDVERVLIQTPLDPPPRDDAGYPYWLLGTLLLRTQAPVDFEMTDTGVAMVLRWPQSNPSPTFSHAK